MPNHPKKPRTIIDAEAVGPDERKKVPAYRPTDRPPMALLTISDDGHRSGEVIRLRDDRFTIGRVEGDYVIPHDSQISSRHLEIQRVQLERGYRWIVNDLGSTNGLFIRVRRIRLVDKMELLLGRGRYRIELPGGIALTGLGHETRLWAAAAMPDPELVDVAAGGTGDRYPLKNNECWLGADPSCGIWRADDPFLSPFHVRFERNRDGHWTAINNKSRNGMWVRTPKIAVSRACVFQIGEQRMRLRIP